MHASEYALDPRQFVRTIEYVVALVRFVRRTRQDPSARTHLLRPGAVAALAAVELILARRAAADFDLPYAAKWAARAHRKEHFSRTLARADALER